MNRNSFERNKGRLSIFLAFAIVVLSILNSSCGEQEKELSPWPPKVQISYQNGGELVLDELGEGNGEKITLTNLDESYRSYEWAPNGRAIAYSSQGNVFVASDNGAVEKVTTGGAPHWSPDGSMIAFIATIDVKGLSPEEQIIAAENNAEKVSSLRIMDLDDMNEYEVDRGGVGFVDWTYDGKAIIFRCSFSLLEEESDKYIIFNIETGEREALAEILPDNIWYMSPSPTAHTIAIGSYTGKDRIKLTLLDYDTKEIRDIYDQGAAKEAEWSPDGQKIAICRYPTTQELYPNYIIILNLDGTVAAELAYDDPVWQKQLGYNSEISWSPDGKKLAFSREYDVKYGVPDIYCWEVNYDASKESTVYKITISGRNHFPRYNPNPS